MLVVHVHIKIKEDQIEKFKQVSIENAQKSIQEPGIARFDILQDKDEPTRFVLNEVYRDEEAPKSHKETPHYQKWRDEMESLMAEPRFSIKFTSIFPGN